MVKVPLKGSVMAKKQKPRIQQDWKSVAIRYISNLEKYRTHIEDHEPGSAWFTTEFKRELSSSQEAFRRL